MAQRVERVTEKTVGPASDRASTRQVREVSEATPAGTTVAQRIIWYIAGILLVLLAFRFVLALLGANPNNSFADFIYTTSHPFVAPFFSLFGYDLQYGVSRFEIYTLVAMAVYAVVAYGLARLFALNEPDEV
ncbi:MAG TPA: hypothetical protein VM535_00825 [Candidatus Saccharimonadales bacterium]|nr:hypothetical protein [Candidatus Saccharimonadales bacterium]